ncbi:MAG TPA: ABC transporter substrate-binding protein [Gemmataceae bacterium]|nr:ABC transporter substrate-binding protein [Gemmataceae bacterium]
MSRVRFAVGCLALALSATWLAAQPPRKEEEEEPPTKEKAKPAVPVPVTEPDRKDPPPAPADDVGTMKEELARSTSGAARDLFKRLLIPYDRLESTFAGGGSNWSIELWPYRELPETEFEVQILDSTLLQSSPKKFGTGSGFKFIPYELRVLDEVDKYLAKEAADRSEQLETAARAVAAGLRFHVEKVAGGKRLGKEWEPVAKDLRARLVKLHRERFTHLVEAKRYNDADLAGLRLMARYPNDTEVKNDVYWLQLKRLHLQVGATEKDPPDPDKLKLREFLLAYEQIPGRKDDVLTGQVRRKLTVWATRLVAEAKDLNARKLTAPALQALRRAEALDPEVPGAGDVRAGLRGTVLYVGVKRLPERMSPATAETDSEKWAVELMFEGLLQAVPEVGLNGADVIGYRPMLAESLPGVMPLGRRFTLPRNVRWSRESPETAAVMDARDVKGTLALLRRPAVKDLWCSVGLDVLQELDQLENPFRFRLAYDQGVLEPLGRATFKVLPAVYLSSKAKEADDAEFAARPFGTGPFRYEGREKEFDRECAVFRANPFYEQRAGRFGLPWIREVRFYVPDASKLVPDTVGGQLHLYPDAPSDAVTRFRKDENLARLTTVATAKTNRRIHLLAVNHRRTELQSDKVRQGLSAAINREAILKEVYRVAGLEKAHHALTGPFPLKSWATPKDAKEAALFRPGAGGLFDEALQGRPIKLRLLYPSDDPLATLAATKIREQVQESSADKAGKPTVEIALDGKPPETFREKLRLEFDFDLALTTFDYGDDLFSLAPLLDPESAGRGGRNIFGYLAAGTNPAESDRRLRRLIDEAGQSRDFSKAVTERTWDIHALFNQRVPFIPLWQLDRFMVAHRDLELHFTDPETGATPERLDPAVVFTGVEMWRLK